MIVEHRTYTFRPGTVDGWLKKYETESGAVQRLFPVPAAGVRDQDRSP